MDFSKLSKNELIKEVSKLQNLLMNGDGKSLKPENHITFSLNSMISRLKSYIDLYENSPDMFFSVRPDGIILSVNETGAKSLGYTKGELIGSEIWKVVFSDDLQDVQDKLNGFIKNHIEYGELGFRKITKSGQIIHVLERTQLICNQAGEVIEIRITCRDITERILAEENLRSQEEKYRTMANHLNVGLYRSTASEGGKFIEVNPAFITIFGYDSKSDLVSQKVSDLYVNSSDRISLQAEVEKKGLVKNREILLRKKDGSHFLGSVSTVAIKNDNDEIEYYNGIIEDITEQKKVTNEIIRKEEQYRTLFDFSPSGIVLEDENGIVMDVNPAFCKLMGYKPKDVIGKSVKMFAHPNQVDLVDRNINKLLMGESMIHKVKSRKKNGDLVLVELNERKFRLPNGNAGLLCIVNDVTESTLAEEALRISEESYKGLFNNATDAIYVLDENSCFIDVNDGAVKMYGYERNYFQGKTPAFLSAPGKNDMEDTVKKINKAFNGKPQTFNFWGLAKDGRVFPKEVRLNVGNYFGKKVVVAFAQDITERFAAETLLRQKEEKYRQIFNAFPDIYFKSTTNGVTTEISPSVEKITGFKPSEVIGVSSGEFYYSKSDWEKIGDLIFEKGNIKDFDTEIQTKSGIVINASLTAQLVFDEDKNPVEIEGVLRDISDRKKAELEVQEKQRQMETLLGNLQGMAYRCLNDKDWTMQFVSSGVKELTGYKQDDLIGNKKIAYADLIHPGDQKNVWDTIQEKIKQKKTFELNYRIFDKNNQLKWVWEQGMGIFDEQGHLLALEGYISDVSAQVEAESEIRKLSRSIEQSPTIVVIADLDSRIEYVNPKFTKVTGFKPKEVIGKKPSILKSGKTPDETYANLWSSITSGKDWYGEFHNRKKNGEEYWESAHIFPLKDDKGKITHFIGMKEDITERKRMEEDLIRAKEKAEESDKLKSTFLANMSHEIRTPMNSIIGFSQLLNEPDISGEERDHYIKLIQNSGNDLLNLIDDIIDISKIEAGQMKIFKSQYFLHNLMQELHINFSEFLKTKPDKANVKLKYKSSENGEKIMIYTDVDRFKQIFRNLINNAIKFTDFGHVEFGFSRCPNSDSPYIRFFVRDTGIGIAPDKQEVIFNSFTQANESDIRLYGGTGLGLAITKKIVKILGGRIWVKSVPGQGSTFYFTLPYNNIVSSKKELPQMVDSFPEKVYFWPDKKILIAEDDEQSFLFFQKLLKKTRVSITRASDGVEALEMVKKDKFDLVLMDIQIPKMNGLVATKQIRKILPELPIVAQTAYAMEGEREKCLNAGCNDYITKPVIKNILFPIIKKYLK